MELDLTTRADRDTTVVTACGDIDLQTAPDLTEALAGALDGQPRRVVLDLQQVGFLDSSALGVMVGAQKRAHAQDSGIVVVASAQNVLRLFRITRLTEVFPIYPTVDEAIAG